MSLKRYLKLAAVLTLSAATALTSLSAAAQEPKRGGTLTYTFHPEPTALSTIATSAVPVAIISTKIFESLLEYEGPQLTPKPGLAQSWTVDAAQRVYTFKLRPGVKWHDGAPFTSADVKFSVEKIDRPLHSRGKVYFGNVAVIETPDPLTVVFKLTEPVPFFLKSFQPGESPMFPKHILEKLNAPCEVLNLCRSRLVPVRSDSKSGRRVRTSFWSAFPTIGKKADLTSIRWY